MLSCIRRVPLLHPPLHALPILLCIVWEILETMVPKSECNMKDFLVGGYVRHRWKRGNVLLVEKGRMCVNGWLNPGLGNKKAVSRLIWGLKQICIPIRKKGWKCFGHIFALSLAPLSHHPRPFRGHKGPWQGLRR